MLRFDPLAHYFINILVTEVRSFIATYPIREDDYWLEIFIFSKYLSPDCQILIIYLQWPGDHFLTALCYKSWVEH